MTYPKGFLVTGIHAGIKRNQQKLDLGIIHSVVPAKVAGVTTQNLVVAAPIVQSRKVLKKGLAQAIIVNSGNANACTGKDGDRAVAAELRQAARSLKVKPGQVLIASTGIIGVKPPIEKLVLGIRVGAKYFLPLRRSPQRYASRNDWNNVAKAILTTDLTIKQKWLTVKHLGKTFALGGITKGSGMIHPNMATMLAFLVTDVDMPLALLRKALQHSNRISFNRISVDGDTSTNDMAVILANGQSGVTIKSERDPLYAKFCGALNDVCISLAKQIILDGEGAFKLITCRVTGAKTEAQAEQVSKTIITSALVKTAIHGQDPNWGRVVAAAGRSGAKLNPAKLNLWFGSKHIFKNGSPVGKPREHFRAPLLKKEVLIRMDLGLGKDEATCWGCDLSSDYVRINTAYS